MATRMEINGVEYETLDDEQTVRNRIGIIIDGQPARFRVKKPPMSHGVELSFTGGGIVSWAVWEVESSSGREQLDKFYGRTN